MTGRTISEFITELYNNPEMEFIYHNHLYIISRYVNSTDYVYTLEYNDLIFSSKISYICDCEIHNTVITPRLCS
jgi:hypothetical protein